MFAFHGAGPRRACTSRCGIEHLREVRMVHECQRLPLGLEAGDDLPRVHPRLDNLEGHLALDGGGLLGNEDDAEAASPICSRSL
jgi:hypothetical protein